MIRLKFALVARHELVWDHGNAAHIKARRLEVVEEDNFTNEPHELKWKNGKHKALKVCTIEAVGCVL